MKVIFILPDIGIGGGTRVVFEHANRLFDKGHQVLIVYPLFPLTFRQTRYSISRLKGFLGNLKRASKVKWFDLRVKVRGVLFLNGNFIPAADIIIATAWPTAFYVDNYKQKRTKKAYFIQSYEVMMGPKERVELSYKLNLAPIVIAPWLKELMRQKFAKEKVYYVPNGVNLEQFYNHDKIYNKHKRILMLYHSVEWKGTDDGLVAFAMAKEKHPEIKLIMFGTHRGKNIPKDAEFHLQPSQEELRQLYCQCDVFLSSSWAEEVWGLTPMEAMACKCAVVATNVGGIPVYTIPGKTVLVSPARKPECLTENLITLLDNEQKLQEISTAGYEYIKNFTWEKANEKLEQVLQEIINEPG